MSQEQLFFWEIDRKQVVADFDGGDIVSDAGLLPMRKLDRALDVIGTVARRLPDPRNPLLTIYPIEELLTQRTYQILAGYSDCNDATSLRNDSLFKSIVGKDPASDETLASRWTFNRMENASTRRGAEQPPETRAAFLEEQAAQRERIKILNAYFPELFVRTRTERPDYLIIDLDATDDAAHGHQQLTLWNSYYDQNQYFPLLAFEGTTGFPLAAWLRPGNAHASWGAVDTLRQLVTYLRQQWPGIMILVRGDSHFAMPDILDFCEAEGLFYAFGYTSNAVLQRRVAGMQADAKLCLNLFGERTRRFARFEDYQSSGWSRPRSILAKVEYTPKGLNTRFVVTNLSGAAEGIYDGFYVGRGEIPEQAIGELKNHLDADRLSCTHFFPNAFRLLVHTLAYALVTLFRQAAAEVEEVAHATVETIRRDLFKLGARVVTTSRRVWFHLSASWPGRDLYQRVCNAIESFLQRYHHLRATAGIPNSAGRRLNE